MYVESERVAGECEWCGLHKVEHCEICSYCIPTHAVDCENGFALCPE